MKYSLLFPGQGAQQVGMGLELTRQSKAAKDVYAQCDEALGFSLSKIIFQGSEEDLRLTANAQPAILTTGIALFRTLQEECGLNFEPTYVAGHSLGEYTALVAAGALSLADGVKLVRRRGELMQEAVPAGQGTMAAILGLEDAVVQQLCTDLSADCLVQPANYNCPKQVVVSGTAEGVKKLCEEAKKAGAKRAMELSVSAPFHCEMMKPVAEPLSELINQLSWKEPICPVVQNVNASATKDIEAIKDGLVKQSYSPVLWTQSVEYMVAQGVTGTIEFGPGKVLTGLVKKIDKTVNCLSIESLADVAKLAEWEI